MDFQRNIAFTRALNPYPVQEMRKGEIGLQHSFRKSPLCIKKVRLCISIRGLILGNRDLRVLGLGRNIRPSGIMGRNGQRTTTEFAAAQKRLPLSGDQREFPVFNLCSIINI